jgi:hypothetical protein
LRHDQRERNAVENVGGVKRSRQTKQPKLTNFWAIFGCFFAKRVSIFPTGSGAPALGFSVHCVTPPSLPDVPVCATFHLVALQIQWYFAQLHHLHLRLSRISISHSVCVLILCVSAARCQANTLAPYLNCIRKTLDASLCLRNFASQKIERPGMLTLP